VLSVSNAAASFADKDVGINKAVAVSGISLAGTDAGNYSFNSTASTMADITRRALTVSAVGQDRVYDGSTLATVILGDNRVNGDVLSVSNATASFVDKNAGTGKALEVGGINVWGIDAGNYSFNSTVSTSANITPRTLAVSAIGQNRVYDGSTLATVALIDDRLSGDVLSVSNSTASFADKNVGINKTVGVSGISLAGTDAGNYISNSVTSTMADITRRALTVSAVGQDRVYDGSTLATVVLADNRVIGDVLSVSNAAASFADKDVGINKAVAVSGISLAGTDAGNYSFNSSTSTTANITFETINDSNDILLNNIIIDGNIGATLNIGGASYSYMVWGECGDDHARKHSHCYTGAR
jgi:hypothetical protein